MSCCSMTAFASMQRQFKTNTGISSLCWEIKSVNHRYLESSFRVPEAFRFLEIEFRRRLRNKLSRGKIDCQLKWHEENNTQISLQLNENLINALCDVSKQLADKRHLANDITLSTLLSWPGVLNVTQPDILSLENESIILLNETLSALMAVREEEGESIKDYLVQKVQKLNEEIERAKQHVGTYRQTAKDKLLTRLDALNLQVDNQQLNQEIALLLTRLDVAEELSRLETHSNQLMNLFQLKEPIGKRLDFLMQELNREANTLSAKSGSVHLTQSAIEMKVIIEQMREQIQNIE